MLEHNPNVDQRTYRYMSPSDPQLVLPFGHGLSLTTFKLSFSNPSQVEQGIDNVFHLQTNGSSSSIQIEIDVQNIGTLRGDEVVQAFSRPIEVPTLAIVPIKSLFHFNFTKIVMSLHVLLGVTVQHDKVSQSCSL